MVRKCHSLYLIAPWMSLIRKRIGPSVDFILNARLEKYLGTPSSH